MNKINKNIFMVLLMASISASSSHAAFAALGSKLAAWGVTKAGVGSMLVGGAAYSLGANYFEASSAQQTLKVAEGISSKVDVLALAVKQSFTLKDVTGPLSFLYWGYRGLQSVDAEVKGALALISSAFMVKNMLDSMRSSRQEQIAATQVAHAASSSECAQHAAPQPDMAKISASVRARKAAQGRRASLDMYLQRA